jgi:hypothetical protein
MSDFELSLEGDDDVVAIVIPAGEYLVRIAHMEKTKGKLGDQIKFRLEVCDGDYEGGSIRSWVDAKLTQTSRLGQFVRNALFEGEEIPSDYKLKSSDLIDAHVTVDCEEYEASNGTVWPSVVAIRPTDYEGDSPYDE